MVYWDRIPNGDRKKRILRDIVEEKIKSKLDKIELPPLLEDFFKKLEKMYENINFDTLKEIYINSLNHKNYQDGKPLFDVEYFLNELKEKKFFNIEIKKLKDIKNYVIKYKNHKIESTIVLKIKKKGNNIKIETIKNYDFCKYISSSIFVLKSLLKQDYTFYITMQHIINSNDIKRPNGQYYLNNDNDNDEKELIFSNNTLNLIYAFYAIDIFLIQIYKDLLTDLNLYKNNYLHKISKDYITLDIIYDILIILFFSLNNSSLGISTIKNYIKNNIKVYLDNKIKDSNELKDLEIILENDPDVYNHYQLEKIKDELEKLEKTKNEALKEIENKTDILNEAITEQKELSEKIKKEQKELNKQMQKSKKQMQKSKNDIFSIMALFLTAFSVSIGFIGFSSQSAILDFNTIVTIGFFITTFIAIIWAIVKEIILYDNSNPKYWYIFNFLAIIFGIYFVSVFILNFLIDGEKFFSLLKYYLYSKYLH